MEPIFITSTEMLASVLPNIWSTVDDEIDIFNKIKAHIISAEQWLLTNIVGSDYEEYIKDEVTALHIRMYVAHAALLDALASLDVVFTNNGFGVVNNQNIVPASKDRMNRLRESLAVNKDYAIIYVVNDLKQFTEWRGSERGAFFAQSIVQSPNEANMLNGKGNTYDNFIDVRASLAFIENLVQRDYVSYPVYRKLMLEKLEGRANNITSALFAEIKNMYNGNTSRQNLYAIVDMIRKQIDSYPEWLESSTAKLYENDGFRNDKKSGGFFF